MWYFIYFPIGRPTFPIGWQSSVFVYLYCLEVLFGPGLVADGRNDNKPFRNMPHLHAPALHMPLLLSQKTNEKPTAADSDKIVEDRAMNFQGMVENSTLQSH